MHKQASAFERQLGEIAPNGRLTSPAAREILARAAREQPASLLGVLQYWVGPGLLEGEPSVDA